LPDNHPDYIWGKYSLSRIVTNPSVGVPGELKMTPYNIYIHLLIRKLPYINDLQNEYQF